MRFTFQAKSGTYQFDRLPVRSLLDVADRMAEADREAAARDADALSLDGAARTAALAGLAERRDLYASLVRSCFTMHGAVGIVRAGCPGADAVLEATEPDEWTRIALLMVGASKVEEDVSGKAESAPTTG